MFKNFIENYQAVRQVLEKVAESDDQRAPDACALLRRIRGLAFVVKLLLCCDFYSIMGKVSKTLQLVNVPIWSKLNAVEEFLQALQDFIQKGKDALPTYQKHEEDLQKCIFQTHPVLLSDVGINMPLRQTRARGADDEHEEPDLVNTKLDHLLQKSVSLADHMTTKMNTHFTPEFIVEIKEKEQAASLLPILLQAQKAANETEMLASSQVQTLTGMHPAHAEEIRNLCINFYRNYKSLADVNTEIELYHKVFTDPNLSNGASHDSQTPQKASWKAWGVLLIRYVHGRGVYSSRKSELFPSANCHLPNPSPNSSPTSKLQVPPNRGHRSIFLTFFCDDFVWHHSAECPLGCTGGCLRGDVHPSEAGKFCIFETGIMQFDEYF